MAAGVPAAVKICVKSGEKGGDILFLEIAIDILE